MVFKTQKLDEPVSFPKNDSDWHSWLLGHVEDALLVREYVENLPKTAATFGLGPIEDELSFRRGNLPNGIVKLTGAWLKPDELTGCNRGASKWVNPNFVHAQHYSDAVTICECGVPILREFFGDKEKQPAHHQDHNDNCCKIYRQRSRVQLMENKREIVKDAAYHGHALIQMNERLGYSDNYHFKTDRAAELGIDAHKLRQDARAKIARTILVLSRDHSSRTIGKLYGIGKSATNRILKRETVGNGRTLWKARRRKKSPNYDYPKPTA